MNAHACTTLTDGQPDPEPCTNVTWAENNGTTVDWARSMWSCLADCDDCRNWSGVA